MRAVTVLAADFGCPNCMHGSFELCMADIFTVHQDCQAQLVWAKGCTTCSIGGWKRHCATAYKCTHDNPAVLHSIIHLFCTLAYLLHEIVQLAYLKGMMLSLCCCAVTPSRRRMRLSVWPRLTVNRAWGNMQSVLYGIVSPM